MLLLSFNIGNEAYAIQSDIVLEVIPLIPIDYVPQVDASIRGIIHYRGQPIPIVDLSIFFSQKMSKQCLSSRIIICQLNIQQHHFTVGLIAEHVTETLQCDKKNLQDNGINKPQKSALGYICRHQNKSIQIINAEQLLPESIQQQLILAQA